MTTKIDNTQDIIDVRDIIERYEELVVLTSEIVPGDAHEALASEHGTLEDLLIDLEGNGGDEEWRGDWYPVTLIRDSYFQTYARELLEDCGDIPRDLPDYIAIDWQTTADNIRVDYTACEIDGITYWYR
jgi:hypothetical protein